MSKCVALGIPYGLYLHSYAMTESAVQGGINHVLRLVNGKNPIMGVYIDMEDADGYKSKNGGIPSKVVNTAIVKSFCRAVAAAGYNAGCLQFKEGS